MRVIFTTLVTAVGLSAATAQAQTNEPQQPAAEPYAPQPSQYAPPQYAAPEGVEPQPQYVAPLSERPQPPWSVDLMLVANALHYTGGMSGEIDYGPGWGMIVGLNPIRNLGLEFSYSGGVNDLSNNFSRDGQLITNQIAGDLRLNLVPPGVALPGHLRPFVFGGGGYHTVAAENATPGITSADGFVVPAGGGVDAMLGGFLLGARFTYNWVYDELDNFSGNRTNYWTVGLNAGTRIW